MAQILKLLDFWPPIVYAIVVYTLFWMLDRNAAPHARKALTNWFAGPKYDKENVATVVIYVFDRFYTSPLLGWRAFLRSALISIVATSLVAYQMYPVIVLAAAKVPEIRHSIFTQVLANVVADYVSLFFIRRWLILGGQRPLMALITAPIIGMLIVIVVYLVRDVGGFSIQTRTFQWSYFLDDFIEWYGFIANQGTRWSLLLPALLVHLWLPLFALGVVVAKVINSVRTAGRFSQWFFLRGEAHPLRSIGYIAAVATFIAVAGVITVRSLSFKH
jgi:hypothetical protein